MSQPPFIIIKGKAKGLQVAHLGRQPGGLYAVQFKGSDKVYNYRNDDVTVLTEAKQRNPRKVTLRLKSGGTVHGVAELYAFSDGLHRHWRVIDKQGNLHDYLASEVVARHSCMAEEETSRVLDYLKRVATVNELGRDEEHGALLPTLYEGIDALSDETVAATYFNPARHSLQHSTGSAPIFPFGCNASQAAAVRAALDNQISVIQGPPGTGKTQTILNIIACAVQQGKSVLVVSNNNSATANVLEKLQKNGFGFLVAPLGRRENKDQFLASQPLLPPDVSHWGLNIYDHMHHAKSVDLALKALKQVFALQEQLAQLVQKQKAVRLEWQHFSQQNGFSADDATLSRNATPKRVMKRWLQFQNHAEQPDSGFAARLRWNWAKLMTKILLKVKTIDLSQAIIHLQALYLQAELKDIAEKIKNTEKMLTELDVKALNDELAQSSMALFKHSLYKRYSGNARRAFANVKDLVKCADEFVLQYPVVLSTTFSARTSLPDHIFDYLIMDEASQVSIETGALALTCARRAVIVGDTMQLPNVVTSPDKVKLDAIFAQCQVPSCYDCASLSFLQSVLAVVPQVPQTLLKEHYRCHPSIINFCSQRFYGGQLLIMTKDHGEPDVMMAIKTVPGNHCRGHYNQREIDVVISEVLPHLSSTDVGIITPYNAQVEAFNRQLPPGIKAATVHKYQGREKDVIIMSVTDDQISDFSDDPNLINVAISRAKRQFILVVSGNSQQHQGNLSDLLGYIAYQNCTVTSSKVNSIFDYLYTQYTAQRLEFLKKHQHISAFDSENLTYALLHDILTSSPQFSHLGILCHVPLRTVVACPQDLSDEERTFVAQMGTHLDFLIINRVTKLPVMAVETDGYAYHHAATRQHQRDLLKDHILELCHLPLLRLSTNGSCEKEKIQSLLTHSMTIPNP